MLLELVSGIFRSRSQPAFVVLRGARYQHNNKLPDDFKITMLLTLLSSLLLSAVSASAARLTISIPPSPPQLPNPATLTSSTHAVLLGPPGVRYDVPLRRDNIFLFPDIDAASYLLTIHSRDHQFPPLRVDVEKTDSAQTISAWQTFRGNEWSNKGPSYGSAQNEATFEVRPFAQKEFYMERGGFNILSFLKSPMILMSLVSVVMIFGLPKMMENMDPEMKAEMEQMSSKGPISGSEGAASQIQNFDLAGWMAGSGGGGASGGSGSKKR
ncbi:uncharacterized protein LTR77_010548 [Saxophila tyrrhenica]|uniref:ER membrane protein complex subunit 7 beta-sandwich domain-containing protein n=1 Tax=Saxophila tyrrhenica TaxID=1690608 RepID=A0AAV9NYQ2_9PEZI|nr:hypothetical protein LTR77_010548 [Saxophila tyrrhenica]